MKVTVESLKDKAGMNVLYESDNTGHGLDAIYTNTQSVFLMFGKVTITLTPEEFMTSIGALAMCLPAISDLFDLTPPPFSESELSEQVKN